MKRVATPVDEVISSQDLDGRFHVRLVDGQELDVDGIAIRGDKLLLNAVVGYERHAPVFVRPDQIASIERVKTDWVKTGILVGSIAVGIGLIIAAMGEINIWEE
jgi:hypothetical protein